MTPVAPARANAWPGRGAACALLAALALAGCPPADDAPTPTPPPPPMYFPLTIGTPDRPARLVGPQAWDQADALPVVLMLHGYSASAAAQDLLLGWSEIVELERFLLILPDGLRDDDGNRFWNATDACCDRDDTGVDDSAYLRGLLDEVLALNVDTRRVFVTGHSNGGFMSYRMACDHAEVVTGIAPLAGAMWEDTTQCPAGPPVAVLHQHGDTDGTVLFEGEPGVPGALASAQYWIQRAGCDLNEFTLGELDLVPNEPGPETQTRLWDRACRDSAEVALWQLRGVGHVPLVGDNYAVETLRWLRDHPR